MSGEESEEDLQEARRRQPAATDQKDCYPDNEARDDRMRQTMATLPGINMARIPSPESLENLKKFILAHQPISKSISQLITFEL